VDPYLAVVTSVTTFYAAIRARDLGGAYASLSPIWRGAQDVREFERGFRNTVDVRFQLSSYSRVSDTVGGVSGTIEAVEEVAPGSVAVARYAATYIVVKGPDDWRIAFGDMRPLGRDPPQSSPLERTQLLEPIAGARLTRPGSVTLTWSALPRASSYRIEVERCAGPDADCDVWRSEPAQGTSIILDLSGARYGRWRVWGLERGAPIGRSDWRRFEAVP